MRSQETEEAGTLKNFFVSTANSGNNLANCFKKSNGQDTFLR